MQKFWILLLIMVVGISTVAAQTATPTASTGEPVISVSPDTVATGETITITGNGFTAGEMMTVFIGLPETGMTGEPLNSAQVAEDGSFTLDFVMPRTFPSGAPIFQRDLLVVAAQDFQPVTSAPFVYDVSLADLGWQEHYNPTFNFSVLAPPDWTPGGSTDGIGFIVPGSEEVGLSVQAVALPQDVDEEAVMAMTLEEYIAVSPELELQLEGISTTTFGDLQPVTTHSGESGITAEWTAENENGEAVLTGKTAYFDLNEMSSDHLYRTIQIRATNPAALLFFDAVVSTFTRGHQQNDDCATGEAEEAEVLDRASLTAALCADGASVTHGDAIPDLTIPIFNAPGEFLIVNGAEVQVYDYADEAAAQADRERISPDGQTINGTPSGWLETPHFFGRGRINVLYVGENRDVITLLERVLGVQFAGGALPPVTDDAARISWEEAEQLILSGEVEMLFQAHSLEVSLTLKDGSRYATTEPSIDEVFRVVEACGEPCAGILLATE